MRLHPHLISYRLKLWLMHERALHRLFLPENQKHWDKRQSLIGYIEEHL